jgi:hypothetical protein
MVCLVVRSRSHEPEKPEATDLRFLLRIGACHGRPRPVLGRCGADVPAIDLRQFGGVPGDHVVDCVTLRTVRL